VRIGVWEAQKLSNQRQKNCQYVQVFLFANQLWRKMAI